MESSPIVLQESRTKEEKRVRKATKNTKARRKLSQQFYNCHDKKEGKWKKNCHDISNFVVTNIEKSPWKTTGDCRNNLKICHDKSPRRMSSMNVVTT